MLGSLVHVVSAAHERLHQVKVILHSRRGERGARSEVRRCGVQGSRQACAEEAEEKEERAADNSERATRAAKGRGLSAAADKGRKLRAVQSVLIGRASRQRRERGRDEAGERSVLARAFLAVSPRAAEQMRHAEGAAVASNRAFRDVSVSLHTRARANARRANRIEGARVWLSGAHLLSTKVLNGRA